MCWHTANHYVIKNIHTHEGKYKIQLCLNELCISTTLAADPKMSLLAVTVHSVINANSDRPYDASMLICMYKSKSHL